MKILLPVTEKSVSDNGRTVPLTFHGLPHTCAAEWYEKFIAEGMTVSEARQTFTVYSVMNGKM